MKKTTELELNFKDIKDLIVSALSKQGIRGANESVVFGEFDGNTLKVKIYHKED